MNLVGLFPRRDTPVGGLRVVLGALDLTAAREPGSEERTVRRVLFHSHFQPFLLDNDIALLQLQEPVALSSVIEPACLPEPGTGGCTATCARATRAVIYLRPPTKAYSLSFCKGGYAFVGERSM